jgi:hypothetical protein
MPYNTVIDFVAYDPLPAADLNTNFDNLDFLKTQLDTHIVNGRLTLETGVAVSTSDQTGKTSVYFAPYRGNRIGLKSGSSWDLYTFSELSLSLSGYIKGVVYDIFCYLSGGSPTLESLAWKKVTASNSPTSGSSKTINISDTGDLAVGREVTIKDGTNSEVTTITALVSNTSITVDLASSYTTPDVYGFNTRATTLTLDDGKWVKSGDATRRYLGTIRITTTTGQCEDSKSKRYVWNCFNRVPRSFFCQDTTDSWNYTTATWRPANNSTSYGTARLGLVIGIAEDIFDAESYAFVYSTGVAYVGVGIGINKTDTNSASLYGGGSNYGSPSGKYKDLLSIGFSYIQRLEISQVAGTTTWYGDAGVTYIQSGMAASMLM